MEKSPNIVIVQETHLDNKIKLALPGYNVLRGGVRRGWSGTALIIDTNIPVRNLKLPSRVSIALLWNAKSMEFGPEFLLFIFQLLN